MDLHTKHFGLKYTRIVVKMMKQEDRDADYHNRDDDDDGDDGDNPMDGSGMREIEVREQDRFLPIANIARIMKTELPGNAKIAKDAKESIQECVSEFISFITSEASDKCLQEKRKTINGDDLLWAMSTLGFDKYIDPLKLYLAKYRDSVKGEKPEKKPSTTSGGRKNEGGSGGNTNTGSSSSMHHGGGAVGSLGGSGLGHGNLNTASMAMNLGLSMPGMGMNSANTMHSMSHPHAHAHGHGHGAVGGDSMLNQNLGMLPSVSNIPGYGGYDGTAASGGSLLMSGGIEASPLFLNANGGAGKLGGDQVLPPLPKKRDIGSVEVPSFGPPGGAGGAGAGGSGGAGMGTMGLNPAAAQAGALPKKPKPN